MIKHENLMKIMDETVSNIQPAEGFGQIESLRAMLTRPLPALSKPPANLVINTRKECKDAAIEFLSEQNLPKGKSDRTCFKAKEIHKALRGLVHTPNRPVIIGLVEILQEQKGNVNISREVSVNLVKKIRGKNQAIERSNILREATAYDNFDMVKAIIPYADFQSLNESLHIALMQKSPRMTEILLSYGAKPDWDLCFQSFAREDNHDMISLLLRCQYKIPESFITESLETATLQGRLDTIKLLFRAGDAHKYLLPAMFLSERAQATAEVSVRSKFESEVFLIEKAVSLFSVAMGIDERDRRRETIKLLLQASFSIYYTQALLELESLVEEWNLKSDPYSYDLHDYTDTSSRTKRDEMIQVFIARKSEYDRYYNRKTRYEQAQSERSGKVAEALVATLLESPVDLSMIEILLRLGNANINHNQGNAICTIVRKCALPVLEFILENSAPSADVIGKAVTCASKLSTDDNEREHKIRRLLRNETTQHSLYDAVLVELGILSATPKAERSLGVLKALLSATAAINSQVARPLCHMTRIGDATIPNLMPKGSLNSLYISPAIRTSSVGPSNYPRSLASVTLKNEISGALISASQKNDFELCQLLIDHGGSVNYQDGAAIAIAISSASIDVLKVLLDGKPLESTFRRAFQDSWALDRPTRRTMVELLFEAGMPLTDQVHNALLEAVQDNHDQPADRSLIEFLLSRNASTLYKQAECFLHALKTLDFETLSLLCTTQEDVSAVVSKVLMQVMPTLFVQSSETRLDVSSHQLPQCAQSINDALVAIVDRCGANGSKHFESLLDLVLEHGADVNFKNGLALQKAALYGSQGILAKLYAKKPNSETLSTAFPYILKSKKEEGVIFQLINAFIGEACHGRELDINYIQPGIDPALFLALEHYPQSKEILRALLSTGCNPDQEKQWTIDESYGDETVSVLCWALCQCKDTLHNSMIEILIEAKANLNYETCKSQNTPLILAVRNGRQESVYKILELGARADCMNLKGQTPLGYASGYGDTEMMKVFIRSGITINDGSLHDAARGLHTDAVDLLYTGGHKLEFPSERHNGRTVLGELCHSSIGAGPLSNEKRLSLEATIDLLIDLGADSTYRSWTTDFTPRTSTADFSACSSTKSILHLALDSINPYPITRILLRKFMYKYINEEFNMFTDTNGLVYSPAMYVLSEHFEGTNEQQKQLWRLLKKYGGGDTYYASKFGATQPKDWTGAPSVVAEEERRKTTREINISEKGEDILIKIKQEELQRRLDVDFMTEKAHKKQIIAHERFGREVEHAAEMSYITDPRQGVLHQMGALEVGSMEVAIPSSPRSAYTDELYDLEAEGVELKIS